MTRPAHIILKGAAALLALVLSALAGGPRAIVGEDDRVRSDAPAVVSPLTVATAESVHAVAVVIPVHAAWIEFSSLFHRFDRASRSRPCGAGGGPRAPC